MHRWILCLIFLCLPVGFLDDPSTIHAQGCAMCQTVMPQANEPIARGMFWSVLFLLTAPFAVSAAIGGWLLQRYRGSQRYALEKESP